MSYSGRSADPYIAIEQTLEGIRLINGSLQLREVSYPEIKPNLRAYNQTLTELLGSSLSLVESPFFYIGWSSNQSRIGASPEQRKYGIFNGIIKIDVSGGTHITLGFYDLFPESNELQANYFLATVDDITVQPTGQGCNLPESGDEQRYYIN